MRTLCIFLFALLFSLKITAQTPAFPGAEGFGAAASGGRGGQVVYVTNLNCSGPGSLNWALEQPGARYVLFKVSGVIPCAAEVREGDVTIAGQTSPGGITVRGLIVDEFYEPEGTGANIIVRHLRSRPFDPDLVPGGGWVLDDALRLEGAQNCIVDHCSFANARDESVQISRSRDITIQNCQLAETVGGHYLLGGMLINYSEPDLPQQNLSIHHNIWNRIGGRFPEIICESPHGAAAKLNIEVSNNLLWDINTTFWYGPNIDPSTTNNKFFLNLNYVNNYAFGRANYCEAMGPASVLEYAQNNLFVSGNQMNLYPQFADYQLFNCCNDFCQAGNNPNTNLGTAQKLTARHPFPNITYQPADQMRAYMAANAGAFPRDSMDRRLMKWVAAGTVDPQPIAALENATTTEAFRLDFNANNPPVAPADSDSDGMPNYWETAHGLNPNVPDHNGTQLSTSITGTAGYTNLECYLNCLSDAKINGQSTAACGISTAIFSPENVPNSWQATPNPFGDRLVFRRSPGDGGEVSIEVFRAGGARVLAAESAGASVEIEAGRLAAGVYFYRIVGKDGLEGWGRVVKE